MGLAAKQTRKLNVIGPTTGRADEFRSDVVFAIFPLKEQPQRARQWDRLCIHARVRRAGDASILDPQPERFQQIFRLQNRLTFVRYRTRKY